MTTKRLVSLAAAVLMVLGVASMAMAGIPDPAQCTATAGSGCLRVVPDGTGDALGTSGLTVSVTVVDGGGNAVQNYPFQDVNLVDNAGGAEISLCTAQWPAALNTNASGQTTITGAGFGGGQTQNGMRVALSGVPITGSVAMTIDVKSADIDGNGAVNLTDWSSLSFGFVQFYQTAGIDFEIDLNCDGNENLVDVSKFAIDNGAVCP